MAINEKNNLVELTSISNSSRLSSFPGSNIIGFYRNPTTALPRHSLAKNQKPWGSINNSIYGNTLYLITQLERQYTFLNPGDVEVFLDENNILIDFLNKFKVELDSEFPGDTKYLELISSPDDYNYKELLIIIRTSLTVKQARLKRERLNQTLVKSLSDEFQAYVPYLSVNIEYY
jgi:hypothetical protein